MSKQDRNRFVTPGLRLVQLYMLMASRGRPYTLTRLADLMGCSRQTILRLIDQINLIPDAECRTWLNKHERYFQVPGPTKAPANLVLNLDSLQHLALCRDIVSHLLPETVKLELHESLQTAARAGNNNESPPPSLAEPWVKGKIDYSPFQEVLEDIQTALQTRRLCQVQYQSRSTGERVPCLVAPLHIVAYREALYLRCRMYDAPAKPQDTCRTLAIHRIKSFRVEKDVFNDSPEDERTPVFGFPYHNPIRVKAAFWDGAAAYVAERVWSPDQKLRKRKDGALVLTFTATSRLEVISWILSFGPDAELIEPKELRAEIQDRAKAIMGRYEKTPPEDKASVSTKEQ